VRGPLCQLALNMNFVDVISLISDIIFLYQLAHARSHNVSTFFSSHSNVYGMVCVLRKSLFKVM